LDARQDSALAVLGETEQGWRMSPFEFDAAAVQRWASSNPCSASIYPTFSGFPGLFEGNVT
jgi:hypothetical protein